MIFTDDDEEINDKNLVNKVEFISSIDIEINQEKINSNNIDKNIK